MVKGYARLKKLFYRFRDEEMNGRKRFTFSRLEKFLIENSGGVSGYENIGGYQGLYQLLQEEKEQGNIIPIKSSDFNGRNPSLKSRWQLQEKEIEGWDDKLIFKLSRWLELGYFLKRPHLQTEELADKLLILADFMQEKANREWASREERSLELFADEKYLGKPAGKKFLSRLKLNLADIKAEKYSQMFVYWNKGISQIREILILENHSAFIACKRVCENEQAIYSYSPDTLIFGSGKQIIDSLQFIYEIADSDKVQLKYAGDLDPEGMFIFTGLKDKYPDLTIKLHLDYYREMLQSKMRIPLNTAQYKRHKVLKKFEFEIIKAGGKDLMVGIEELWESDHRIPQEVITYEKLIEGDE